MNLSDLRLPFPEKDVGWRIQQVGTKNNTPWAICVAYLRARAIMDRLDLVVGPENWANQFAPGPAGGVICGISIYDLATGRWIIKWDGADNTEIEPIKGGISNSMKRAAVQWGIGRYLYDLGVSFAKVTQNGKYLQKGKPGQHESFRWDPPILPAWALPARKSNPTDISGKTKSAISSFEKFKITQKDLERWLGDFSSSPPLAANLWEDKEIGRLRICFEDIVKTPEEEREAKVNEIFHHGTAIPT